VTLYGEKRVPADDTPTVQVAAVSWPGSRILPVRAIDDTDPRGLAVRGPVKADPTGDESAVEDPAVAAAEPVEPAKPVDPVGAEPAGVTAAGIAAAGVAPAGVATAEGGSAGGGPADDEPAGVGAAVGWHRRKALLAGVIAGVVLAAAGGATAYAYSGEIPHGTSVLGTDLGGKSRAEAVAALRANLTRRASTLDAPVPVRVGEQTIEIKPAEVGLSVDVEATVAASTQARPHPLDLLFGSRTVEPVVRVDAAALDSKLRETAARDQPKMTMPAITFDGTTPKPVYPSPGRGLDAERSATAVREGWLSGRAVAVPLVETHPATTAEDVDRLITELARPAVSAPITVVTDSGSFLLPPTAIAKSLVLSADQTGKIDPRVDEGKLRTALGTQLSAFEVAPKEATVAIDAGKPRLVAGADGRQVDLGR
jgi:hypothetical protein